MDISDGAILQSSPSSNLTKGNCCILVFITCQFVWCQLSCDHKNKSIISWFIFIQELIAHYGDINRNTFFIQLANLKQKGLVTEHIKQFQQLSLRVKNISDDNL